MKTSKPSLGLSPRLKVWFERDGRYVFGHGLCEILQAVDSTGSLKEAARAVGKSYRYIWGQVKKAEQALNSPLAHREAARVSRGG